MEDSLRNWLKSFGLHEYEKRFENDGWENLDDVFHIDQDDLNECIHKAGHRKIFHLAVQETKATGVHPSVKIQESNEGPNPDDDYSYLEQKTKEVELWLKRIGLGQYAANFQEEGWDRLEVIKDMDDQEIRNCIHKPGHRTRFKIAMKRDDPASFELMSPEISATVVPDAIQEKYVKKWLTENGLQLYFGKLVEEGWDTLDVLFELDNNEADLKECISRPGHRKRFQRAVIREQAERNHGAQTSVKVSEEMENMQVTMQTGTDDITYVRNASNDSNTDSVTVPKFFVPAATEPLSKSKKNFIADVASVKEDGLNQRYASC